MAAAVEAWGISESVFLTGFAVIAVLLYVAALVFRRSVRAGGGLKTDDRMLHPYEVAYLLSGKEQTLSAVLTSLRMIHLIETAAHREFQAKADAVPLQNALDDAVYARISRKKAGFAKILRDSAVRKVLAELGGHLERDGLALPRKGRRALDAATLPLVALVGVAVWRAVALIQNEAANIFTICAGFALFVVTAGMLLNRSRATAAGERAIKAAKERSRVLHERITPETYGPAEAALGVALGGTYMRNVDENFAKAARIISSNPAD